jgi:hypothetical protein
VADSFSVKEYDVYLPSQYNDGRAIENEKHDRFKQLLVDEFGGLTHFLQENEGIWLFGGITFRDRVMIVRVLARDADRARTFFEEFRIELMRSLEQTDVLIVERDVSLVT